VRHDGRGRGHTPSFSTDGKTWWCCSIRCRDRFAAHPTAFTTGHAAKQMAFDRRGLARLV
jgi:hypothetical protein